MKQKWSRYTPYILKSLNLASNLGEVTRSQLSQVTSQGREIHRICTRSWKKIEAALGGHEAEKYLHTICPQLTDKMMIDFCWEMCDFWKVGIDSNKLCKVVKFGNVDVLWNMNQPQKCSYMWISRLFQLSRSGWPGRRRTLPLPWRPTRGRRRAVHHFGIAKVGTPPPKARQRVVWMGKMNENDGKGKSLRKIWENDGKGMKSLVPFECFRWVIDWILFVLWKLMPSYLSRNGWTYNMYKIIHLNHGCSWIIFNFLSESVHPFLM